ncbi:MAG TPA: ribose 5-phosphate isomerase B [Phycisphaerales bacterium]|nr:ribose 5-phosphate isomerase B [Phycisphaerales bacterium]
MRIALGSDHRGTAAIKQLADSLDREGHTVEVMGAQTDAATDYPESAFAVGKAIAEHRADLGILVCGTGIGMSIAANKVKGVRAAVAHDELTAQLSRSHNDANVLCLSADLLGQRLIEKIVSTWIATEFGGGRHARRIHKIEAIEQGKDPSTVVE